MGKGLRDNMRKAASRAAKKQGGGAAREVGPTPSPKATGVDAELVASAKAAIRMGMEPTPKQRAALDRAEAPVREAEAKAARLKAEAEEEKETRRKAKLDAKARKITGNCFGTREVSAGLLEDPAAMSFAKRHNVLG